MKIRDEREFVEDYLIATNPPLYNVTDAITRARALWYSLNKILPYER